MPTFGDPWFYPISHGTGLLERPGLDLTDLSGAPRTEAGMGAENPNNGVKLGGGCCFLDVWARHGGAI